MPKKGVWTATAKTIDPPRGVTVAEMIPDVGGGWLVGNLLEGPFRYMEENDYKPPVEGTVYHISFRTKDNQYIWDMKCGPVRNVAPHGGALRFEKI